MSESNVPTRCATCGQELGPGTAFCGGCGAPAVTTNSCASCGSELPAHASFCGACGHRTADPVPPAQDAPDAEQQPTAILARPVELSPPFPEYSQAQAVQPLPAKAKRRALPWIIAGAAVLVVGAVVGVVLLVLGGGSGGSAGADKDPSLGVGGGRSEANTQTTETSTPSGGTPPPRVPRTIELTGLAAVAGGSGRCFGPKKNAFIVFDGVKYAKNFLQCGDRSGDRASGRFVVDLAAQIGGVGSEITGFSATVGIDETSRSDASTADWLVRYGDTVICEIGTTKGAPSKCEAAGLSIPVVAGKRLVLEQAVVSADPTRSLWAAFHQAKVSLLVDPAAPDTSPPTTVPAPSVEQTGVTADVVAFSGGEGVRYRNSPSVNDLVPGNGPFEGDSVTVYCYTTGEAVRGNVNWARVGENPDRYVPATFLRDGNAGSVPPGVPAC